jgi:hypothetical protein
MFDRYKEEVLRFASVAF